MRRARPPPRPSAGRPCGSPPAAPAAWAASRGARPPRGRSGALPAGAPLPPEAQGPPLRLTHCVGQLGQLRRAEQEFLKVLAIDPDDAGTHYNLGILYEESLHNRAKARQHYQRFIELAPQDPDAGNVQAWLMSLK